MPLDKNMSHEEMVKELMASYEKNGKIGSTKPRDEKHALEIANAVAYNIEESNEVKEIDRKVKEMTLDEMLNKWEEFLSAKEKELGISEIEENPKVKVTLDSGETFETEVDPATSEDELEQQYKAGTEINVGKEGQERKARIKSATLTKQVGEDFEGEEPQAEIIENPINVVSMDIPLLLRILEWAREDSTKDEDLHFLTENLIEAMVGTEFLAMEDYDKVIPTNSCVACEEEPIDDSELDLPMEVEEELEECDATTSSDMGADQVLPFGKKNKVKKLKSNKSNHIPTPRH